MKDQRLVNIDLEMTGTNPNRCQILEFGAVIFDPYTVQPLDELPRYRKILKQEYLTGQPVALQMNAGLIAEIAKGENVDLIAPGNLLKDFRQWLRDNNMPDQKIPVAGRAFNEFDKKFIENLPYYFPDLFKLFVVDPAKLYWEPGEERFPSLAECLRRAGMDDRIPHNAVDDAILVTRLIWGRSEKIGVYG